MTPAFVRACVAAVLACAAFTPTLAQAAGPVAELRAPAAPDKDVDERLASALASIDPSLHAPLAAVVDDVIRRLRANAREVADGKADPVSIREAARAALLEADFAGVTKKKSKALEAAIDLTVLQLGVTVHVQLRDQLGRQLAIRAVRRCAGKTACLDAIAPTDLMLERHVANVRQSFDGDAKALASAEQLGNVDVLHTTVVYSRANKAQSDMSSKWSQTQSAIVQHLK